MAAAHFQKTCEWYAAQSLPAEAKWIAAMEQALDLLERNPLQSSKVSEADLQPLDLRQLNFGAGQRITHRIVFAVRPQKVVVYAIRHLAQEKLAIDDL
jgi:hypothetical protein